MRNQPERAAMPAYLALRVFASVAPRCDFRSPLYGNSFLDERKRLQSSSALITAFIHLAGAQ